MNFSGKLITSDLPDDMWEIVKSYYFIDSQGARFDVFANFKTDGASIPRFLWRVVGHPRATDIAQAAGVHDHLYKYNGVKRKRADQILIEGMKVLGAPWWKRRLVYAGVRAGGWKPWNAYRRA